MVSLFSDFHNYYLLGFFSIIGAPFPKEVENKKLPNSRAIDEIPLTSGFNSQMLKVEDVESLNSFATIEVSLDEIPLILGFDFKMPCSLTMEVIPFHVIFNLNGVLITTWFIKGFRTIILYLGLKEFLNKCLIQFQMYIWFAAQHHNIYNYLNKNWHKTQVFHKEFCMRKTHLIPDKLDKPIFHKNLDVFFSIDELSLHSC